MSNQLYLCATLNSPFATTALEPSCSAQLEAENQPDMQEERGYEVNEKQIEWCCVPVIVDNAISDLFQMPAPNNDSKQEPAFLVTQSTVDLVPQDFERYKPSLQRMAEDWRKEKERVMHPSEVSTETRN